MSSSSATTKTVRLEATYASPTHAPQLLSSTALELPVGDRPETEARTTYLRALRAATSALQDRINAELTARMDEDARRKDAATKDDGTAGTGKAATRVDDDVAEEENYGEEVPGDEEEV